MTQQPEQRGIAHLRCADEDRELVAQLLNNAYADGRLDFEEHSERIAQAYQAKTFADLDTLTLDLIPQASQPAPPPANPSPAPLTADARPRPSTPVAPHAFAGGRAILSSFRPGSPVVMPDFSEITCVLGDARLDLVGATFTSSQTTIRVNCVMGDVRVRVPHGVHVVGHVSTVLGDFKVEGAAHGTATDHVLVIEGTSFLGDVKVLGPNAKQRKYEKFI